MAVYERLPTGAWVPVAPSADGTSVPSTAAITDASGNVWTLSGGIVHINGAPDLTTWGVIEILYIGGLIWQFNGTNWYSKTVPVWTMGTGIATLTWTPPTTNIDGTPITGLTGYVISYGQSALSNTVNLSLVSTYTFVSLPTGTWYFSIKAVNRFNVSSAQSTIVSKVIL